MIINSSLYKIKSPGQQTKNKQQHTAGSAMTACASTQASLAELQLEEMDITKTC
jgi:hypothetical protein